MQYEYTDYSPYGLEILEKQTVCKTLSQAERLAMLHFLHYEIENFVILMLGVRQK